MPMFARRPSNTSSSIPVEIQQKPWLDNKDCKYRSCNSTKSLLHILFFSEDTGLRIKWLLVLIFHRTLCYGSAKWRWSIHGWFQIRAVGCWKEISQNTNKQRWRNPPRYWRKARRNMLVLSKLTGPREFDWKEFLKGIFRAEMSTQMNGADFVFSD